MSGTKKLKQVLSLSFLQEVFTTVIVRALFPEVLMERGTPVNIDEDLPEGIYTTMANCLGTFPSDMFKYGKLIVLGKRNQTRFQVGIAEGGHMASRSYYNGSWNAWRMLT